MFCFNFQFSPFHAQFKNQQPNQKFKMQIVKYQNAIGFISNKLLFQIGLFIQSTTDYIKFTHLFLFLIFLANNASLDQ